jgi:NAD(P)-dependent dehydrogenase (short-subunit alcohol dehydrogenase family)
MDDLSGKLAVVTGAGTGMGRELALQLVRAGAHVAICDVFADSLAEAKAACEASAPAGTRVSACLCDVSDEAQVIAFRDAVLREHGCDHIHLLFNNAGIAGGGSFVLNLREQWERTFNVCWFGVYYCTRAFLPLLIESDAGHIVNTSSVNGFYAFGVLGPNTAYSTAKFAVKGFSEALVTDLRLNAPHVHVSVVMPGHIGTSILSNTQRSQGSASPSAMTAEQLARTRRALVDLDIAPDALSDDQLRALIQQQVDAFRERAPLSAAQAATIILDGVRQGRWRILVGDDAQMLDQVAREHPEELYDPAFLKETLARLRDRSRRSRTD